MSYKIISCDGGGIRGLLTAKLIDDLDRKFHIIEKADAFSGTSTGGLLALGMAQGIPLSTLIDLYRKDGNQIFTPNGAQYNEMNDTLGCGHFLNDELNVVVGDGFSRSRYISEGLKHLLQSIFTDRLLSDSKSFVVLNTAQLWNEKAQSWWPCTLSSHSLNPFNEMSMVDAALSTSAAPTYFPPHPVRVNGTDLGYFVDGGVFANNPSMTALTEVLFGQQAELKDIYMLSVGTGHSKEGIPRNVIDKEGKENWGEKNWLWPARWGEEKTVPPLALLELALTTSAELAEVQACQILGPRYLRANVTLSQPYALDDWENIDTFEKEVDQFLKTTEWENICHRVEQDWQ